jgi:hypothetical protein
LANSAFHTIAVTHNINGEIIVYADGVAVATGTKTYNASTAVDRLGLGKNGNDQAREMYVAELKMYSGALNASQVAALHTAANTAWA